MVAQKPGSADKPLMYGGILPQEEMLEIGKKHKKIIIGIPKDNQSQERRVTLTPEAVEVLVNNGHDILMETKAGEGARYSDTEYSECGGFIIENKKQVLGADIILKVAPLNNEEISMLKSDQLIITSLQINNQKKDYIRKLMDKKVTAIAF